VNTCIQSKMKHLLSVVPIMVLLEGLTEHVNKKNM